jgi:hypothetical protein
MSPPEWVFGITILPGELQIGYGFGKTSGRGTEKDTGETKMAARQE